MSRNGFTLIELLAAIFVVTAISVTWENVRSSYGLWWGIGAGLSAGALSMALVISVYRWSWQRAVEAYKDIKPAADFMKELLGQISKLRRSDKSDIVIGEDYEELTEKAFRELPWIQLGSAHSQLQQLLRDIAPENYEAKRWGDMRRVRMPDNTYRWMCDYHATEMGR